MSEVRLDRPDTTAATAKPPEALDAGHGVPTPAPTRLSRTIRDTVAAARGPRLAGPSLPEGRLLSGRYRILEVVGQGGMGTVYRALDENLGEEVAIKVLRPEHVDEDLLRRFRKEWSVARRIVHRNVVRIRDLGEEEGIVFLVLDYVAGTSLREVLRQRGALPPDEALAIARQVAAALGEAHEQGIVHRDVKPANVLLDLDGQAYLSDFGVARSLHTPLTMTGEILGTPDYLSPEQARGESVDKRSDLYSLGIVLFEMLTGKSPFSGGTLLEVMAQHMAGKAVELDVRGGDLEPQLASLLRRCLAKNADERYQSAAELLAELDGLRPRVRLPSPRRVALWVLVAAGAAAGFFAWRSAFSDRDGAGVTTVSPNATATGPRHSVAVLPFAGGGLPPQLDWAPVGIAEILASTLSESEALRVVESARVVRLLHDLRLDVERLGEGDLKQLADLLQVDRVISGRLRSLGDRTRIEASLFAADSPLARPRQVFGEESAAGDFFGLAEKLAAHVRQDLEVPSEPAAPIASKSADAIAAYGRGLKLLLDGSPLEAVEPLSQATELDAGFTQAWVRLARALREVGRDDEAATAARRAVESLGVSTGGRLELEVRAQDATRRGAWGDAQRTLEDLVRRFPNDVESRIALAETYGAAGDLEKARAELEGVVVLDASNGRAWYLLGRYAIQAGDPRPAVEEHLVRALVVFNKLRNEQGQGDVSNAMGVGLEHLGRLEEARESYEKAAAARRHLGDERGLAATLTNLGRVDLTRGDFESAAARSREALALQTRLGNRAGIAEVTNNLGMLAEEKGEIAEALGHYRQALQLRKELGDERALAESYANVAFADYLLGRYDDSLLYGEQALALQRRNGDRFGALLVSQTIGACQLDQGLFQEATKIFVEALEEGRSLDAGQAVAAAQGQLGRVAHAQGRFAAAFASYGAALTQLAELDDRRGQIEMTLHQADAFLAIGRPDAARERLERVSAWGRDGISLEQQSRLAVLQGEERLAQGDRAGAEARFMAALEAARRSRSPVAELGARLDAAALRGNGRELASVAREATALGHALLRLEAAEELARFDLVRGEVEPAIATLREALRLVDRGGSYGGAYRLHELLAEALERQGEATAATAEREAATAERARIVEGVDGQRIEPALPE